MADGQNIVLLFWKAWREESQLLLWCGISHLGASIFPASISPYQSVNLCLAAAILSVFIAYSWKICRNF